MVLAKHDDPFQAGRWRWNATSLQRVAPDVVLAEVLSAYNAGE